MNAGKQAYGQRLADEQADLVAVHNAEHAAGGVQAHHLGDQQLRMLHEKANAG